MVIGEIHEEHRWIPIRGLIDAVREIDDAVAHSATEAIRNEVPEYVTLPYDEHQAAVRLQQKYRLDLLDRQETLSAEALASAGRLARRRARQGVPVGAILSSFQIGDRVLWRALMDLAPRKAVPLLPEAASLMLAAASQMGAVLAQEHALALRMIEGGRIALAHEFHKALPDPASEKAATALAARLGLDPTGWFIAIAWRPIGVDDEHVLDEISAITQRNGGTLMVLVDGVYLAVTQQSEPEKVQREISSYLTAGRFGVGAARRGISGARMSLTDAELALRATRANRPVVHFGSDWMESLILGEAPRLLELLQAPIETARAHSHLATTVLAFADADMSVARTAAAVHLHANSVTYRLDRWHALSGLNPRSFMGLAYSVSACRLAE